MLYFTPRFHQSGRTILFGHATIYSCIVTTCVVENCVIVCRSNRYKYCHRLASLSFDDVVFHSTAVLVMRFYFFTSYSVFTMSSLCACVCAVKYDRFLLRALMFII